MNIPLLAGAVLLLFVAVAHSYLGERYILMRLFRRVSLPPFTSRTLRLAWHVTSVLGLGFAAILFMLASPAGMSARAAAQIVSVTCALCALMAFAFSRGRHLSWIVFLAVALLAWFG